MNKYFNINRFGKYLTYDLNRIRGNYVISALITGLMPVMFFLFYELFSLVFEQGLAEIPGFTKAIAFFASYVVFSISAPTKIYGDITDKRAGSDWLMIPASSLEKLLSMLLMLCVALPLVFCVLFFGSDLILSVLFSNLYGDSLLLDINGALSTLFDSMGEMDFITISAAGKMLPWIGWCGSVLTFALGAILFKKNKVAKTILCCFAISSIFTSLLAVFAPDINIDLDNLNISEKTVQFWFNFVGNAINLVVFGCLIGGLYYRIKTIKH